jgi:hypothetical protein
MRLLLLHTDETIRAFMPELVSGGVVGDFDLKTIQFQSEDGKPLTYERAVALLKEDFDCLIVNLRLPSMLSIRLAEMVHLARVPCRLLLLSGAPKDLGPGASLFDDYIRTPCYEKSLHVTLAECLSKPFAPERRPLATQEHLDIAILNLFHRSDSLTPGCRGALHAFALYRDAYLHRPGSAWPNLQNADLTERIDFFAAVQPLEFANRLGKVMDRVDQSPLYRRDQKRFLSAQFNYLLDASGLILLNFRQEVEKVLKGLEQFSFMAGADAEKTAEISPARLREALLRHSKPIPYVNQGVARIAELLPASG